MEIEDLGLTEKQILKLFGKHVIDGMAGNTCAIIDGKEVFYYCDIIRIARFK